MPREVPEWGGGEGAGEGLSPVHSVGQTRLAVGPSSGPSLPEGFRQPWRIPWGHSADSLRTDIAEPLESWNPSLNRCGSILGPFNQIDLLGPSWMRPGVWSLDQSKNSGCWLSLLFILKRTKRGLMGAMAWRCLAWQLPGVWYIIKIPFCCSVPGKTFLNLDEVYWYEL